LQIENKYLSIPPMNYIAHMDPFHQEEKNSKLNLFFLIGFMASGKSSLGRKAAETLRIRHMEMDDEIIRVSGKSINRIFEEDGEEIFRKTERQILEDIISTNEIGQMPLLVSTGGGAPCYFDNMDLMKRKGWTIFINPSREILTNRLESKKEDRPLIRHKSKEEIHEFVTETMRKRIQYYSVADIFFNPLYDDEELNANFLSKIIKSNLRT